MTRCLSDCKHNDDGFCDESGWFSPTIELVSTASGWYPICTDYKETDLEEEEAE